MERFTSFDDWVAAQRSDHHKLISRLRRLVARAAPGLSETCKWGNGCWVKGDLPLVFVHAEQDHLQLGFFGGALLNDPKNLLRGKGKYVRHVRIEGPKDIDEAELSTMVRRAVRAPAYK